MSITNDTGKGQKITKGKVWMYPVVALKILGHQLMIGDEKGYSKNSWWKGNRVPRSYYLEAAQRHILAYETGEPNDEGWYNEVKPDGTVCKTKANHIWAAAWNLMRVALSIYFGRIDEDDRFMYHNEFKTGVPKPTINLHVTSSNSMGADIYHGSK